MKIAEMVNLFLILALVSTTAYSANVCTKGKVVNMPANNARPFYWPTSWNENQTAPLLQNYQACSWTVTVPNGYYAKLIMDGKTTDKASQFQTIDCAGNLIETTHEAMEPYYFPSPKFTIALSNQGTAHFGFKIVWVKYPNDLLRTINAVGSIPYNLNITATVSANIYASPEQVSLLVFPADHKNTFSYRSTMIFDGVNFDASYVTNAFLVQKTNKELISANGGFYVFNADAHQGSTDQILIQDYKYTKDLKQYRELSCDPNVNCTISINGGTTKKSGLVSVKDVKQTLTSITLDDAATLSIYYGSQDTFCFDRAYTASEIRAAVPVTFPGGVMQYVISRGKADFTFVFQQ